MVKIETLDDIVETHILCDYARNGPLRGRSGSTGSGTGGVNINQLFSSRSIA